MASLSSLIPSEVLAAMVEESLRKALVAGDAVNTTYAGTISNAGDSVSIPVIGDVTISDYTKGNDITYQSLDSGSQILKVDQAKSFSFDVEDIDSKQALLNIVSLYADRAAYNLRDTVDTWLLQDVMGADAGIKGTAYNLGTAAAPVSVASSGVLPALGAIAEALDKNNVPQEGRFAIIPAWFHTRLVLAGILERQDGSEDAFTNGKVGRAFGFDLRVSNNLKNASTGTATEILAGVKLATSFVGQINTIEIIRREKRFADAVRGLMVYGSKVTQAKALAKFVGTAA